MLHWGNNLLLLMNIHAANALFVLPKKFLYEIYMSTMVNFSLSLLWELPQCIKIKQIHRCTSLIKETVN